MGVLLLTRYLPTEYKCHVPMYPIFSFTAKGYSVSSLSFQDQTFHFSNRIPPSHPPPLFTILPITRNLQQAGLQHRSLTSVLFLTA